MSFPPRRVVTGHDDQGRAVVTIDAPIHTARSLRQGHESCVIWTTGGEADDAPSTDAADQAVGRSLDGGTVFRITRYDPGAASSPHQTDSVDYAVVLSGEIELVMDGEATTLRAGDVLVQRGTRHDWVNNGAEPCTIAFCLVSTRRRDRKASGPATPR